MHQRLTAFLNHFPEEENGDCMAGAERWQARGHRFARYADDFLVMVKSAKAASRVMASLVRFCEGRLKLVVNRAKSRCTRLGFCEFLGYAMDRKGRLV